MLRCLPAPARAQLRVAHAQSSWHARPAVRHLALVPACRPRACRVATRALQTSGLAGWGLFFAPGAAVLAYALVRGKGNLRDGLSRLLTEVSQGYLNPNVGGANIPTAAGELSDLAGDQPLFKALDQW